ncbi:LPXTG cell wall anchor domain-containing protein, partial [Facklamia sp. P13055]|uniref:LPXTG cell wall anchor domain-containing protein n=1 Tax=Facklamia sp. P13055 TaxID=3421952 RepID=UPI003D17F857
DGGTPDEEAPDGGTPDEEAPDGGTPDDSTPSEGTPDDDTPDNDTLADSSPNDGVKNGDESTMVTKSAILSTSLPKTGENDPYLIFSASVLTLLGGLGLYQRSVSKKDNFV